MPEAKKLDKLCIPTRYPNGLPDLIPAEVHTQEEAEAAIASARSINQSYCITYALPSSAKRASISPAGSG